MGDHRYVGLAWIFAALTAGAAPALATNQTPTITLPVTNYPLPYGLGLATDDFGATPMPTLQSFAGAEQDGLWVMIGGRTNGLHGFSTSGLTNFPPAFQNRDVWLIDPVTKQSWSRSLEGSGLPLPIVDMLTAANYEEMQIGGKLYMVGGYGFDRTQNKFLTYDALTSVDLDGLIAWVKGDPGAPALTSIFRSVHDPALQVTGGEMTEIDGRAMLVFGQNFDGDYTPGANGNYTNQVRSFTITDTATTLAIGSLTASPSPGDPSQYRRRDFIMIDVLREDPVTRALTPGLVQLSGVFTSSNGGWTVPVEVGPDGVPHEADPAAPATFKQGLNNYSAARFASFSRVTGANYDTLFGGISAGTFDTATNTFTPDPGLPFNNVITTIVIDRNDTYTQAIMPAAFPTILSQTNNQPLLFGANAHFFLADGIPTFPDSEIIDLDALMASATSDSVTVGQIFGGISADKPNGGNTAASNLVFDVTMTLPPFVDLNAAGTTTAAAGAMARRLLIENAGAQYSIPLGADLTAFGGAMVTAGRLVVNGNLAARSLSIGAGGTLSGTGTIDAPATIGGTLHPGNSPGTLTFTQPVVQSGTLALDIDGTGTGNGAGNYSRVVVAGAASTFTAGGSVAPLLRGITGSASNMFTPALGQRFTIVSAAGGVNGSFASLTQPAAGLAPGTRFDVAYASNSIDLFVTPASFADLSAFGGEPTPNREATGGAIDALRGPAGPAMSGDQAAVIDALYGLSPGGISDAFDQIAGTVHGDALSAALSLNRLFAFSDGHWGGTSNAGPLQLGFAPLGVLASPEPAALNGTSPFWAHAAGQWTNMASDGNAPGHTDSAGGVIAGFDIVHDDDTRFGVAGSYTVSDVTTRNGAAANVQGGRAFLYGSKISGAWRFDHEVTLGFDGYHTRRLIQIGGAPRTAFGKADGYNVSLDLAARYDFGFAIPFGEFRYDRIHRDSFTETGAGSLSLAVADGVLDAPRLVAGADFDLIRAFDQPEPDCLVTLRLAWAHDFDGTFGVTDAALTGAPAARFAVFSSQPGRDAGLLDLNAATRIGGVEVFGAYSLEAREREIAQAVSLGLRATW
ncbi:MAG TPA: autotransporter domain-containing protein [Rhizomicrobium sp.]|nr:autotransporter domain-containing protein [Rhizomicrobium sp.]